jgi:hypothetical protein
VEIKMAIAHRNTATRIAVVSLLFLAFAPIAAMAQVAWVKGFDAALQQAAKEKKFVILDISATW